MQHDRFAVRRARIVIGQSARAVFVRQAVEAVADHAAIGDRFGQRECLRNRRLRAMERGVEAGDLRKLWQSLEQRAYRRQVVRLMQRRERYVFFERAEHGRAEAHGLRVLESTVDDAMSDTDEPMLGELVAE